MTSVLSDSDPKARDSLQRNQFDFKIRKLTPNVSCDLEQSRTAGCEQL